MESIQKLIEILSGLIAMLSHNWQLVLLVCGMIFLVVLSDLIRRQRKTRQKAAEYTRKPSILTEEEQRFYRVLQVVVGMRYAIQAQVALIEVFQPKGGKNYYSSRNQIAGKHIDFLLCDPDSLMPMLGIELDDPSHQQTDRTVRDRFINQLFATHNLPLLRIKNAYGYKPEALADEIISALRQRNGKKH